MIRPLLRILLATLTLARLARAQSGSVSGTVFDSIGQTALAHATVQLASADGSGRFGRSVLTDTRGGFVIADVPDGAYTLGFLHPTLDSLGIDPPMRAVVLHGGNVRADLGIPSAETLRHTICRNAAADDSSMVVIGIVRGAAGRAPIAGAKVAAEWSEITIGAGTPRPRLAELDATTGANGWFAICDVPRSANIALRAMRGADSTDLIDLQTQSDVFLHRDLYLAEPGARAVDLHGTAIRNPDGIPLPGVEVVIAGLTSARTNAQGEWSLAHVPAGTRELQIRAIGYFQLRTPIDVLDSVAAIPIALSTLQAVLDTVRIHGSPSQRLHQQEFENRRRSGIGRYITEQDIADAKPLATSDLFRNVSNLAISQPRGAADRKIWMRGTFNALCNPAVYVNGLLMNELNADEIDALANPDEVAGIEVYSATTAPAPFNEAFVAAGRDRCGSIVIWTKQPPDSGSRVAFWKRLAAGGTIAGFILLGFLKL